MTQNDVLEKNQVYLRTFFGGGSVVYFNQHYTTRKGNFVKGYMSALPRGDEAMLHSVRIIVIWRMAISDIPLSICFITEQN